MNTKSKYAVLLISSLVVVYAVVGGMFDRVSAQDGSYPQLSLFWEVWSKVQTDYVDEPTMSGAMMGAVRGLIEQVDPYGGYLTSKDVTFYKSFDPLKTPGIGVVLSKPPQIGYPMIISAIPGGPADRAGLGMLDIIEAIDGITTREMNLVQVNGYLANPPDKPVSLTVIRRGRGEPETISVNREILKVPPVESKMIESNIAYLRVPFLAPGKAAEARKQLEGLLQKGATEIVLDLRYTAGGEEQEAVGLANLFVDNGLIGYLQGQKFEKKVLSADPKAIVTKAPVVVLVNQGTSGAAELVAGAISDNNRGQVVGMRTFGTGSIQRLIPVTPDGTALLISVAKYYTPAGKEIQGAGIRPGVEVASVIEEQVDANGEPAPAPAPAPPAEDRQLNKAIEVLKAAKVAKKAA